MKDIVVNIFLRLLSELRRLFKIRKPILLNTHNLTFHDFNIGYKWAKEKPYHPNNLSQYYDSSCVIIRDPYRPIITSEKKPKCFHIGDSIVTIPYATGVLESKKTFKYGYFEAELNFPIGDGQWPAFWLTGENSWPPEIDIVEGYSKDDNYKKNRRFQSNIHYIDDNNYNRMIKAKNHPLLKRNGEWHKFGLHWTEDFIKFYYDDYLVRVVTDKKVLDKMNQPMHIMFNSAIQPDYNIPQISTFLIKNIKYFPHIK